MSRKSPFVIQKAIQGIGGEPKSVKSLRSGDLLVETASALQTKSFLLAKTFLDCPLTASPHKSLNSSRGDISEYDLMYTSESEILHEFSDGDRFNSCQVIYSQFGLAIHQNDHQARRRFVEWAQNEIAVVPDFHKRILFSDEAHFWLNGYVNKQNCRIWSEANPQVYVETPLHLEKLNVWCTLWAGGIIGPYFFKNDEGHNEPWFQQDGATCHTARATIDLLKDTFGDRLISRFGPLNWPPRSCDLTPLDYFLWGYVKSLIYADKPQTLDHLEDNIRRFIADIRPQMLEKVIENWTSRLDYIRASHMPEIIFKIATDQSQQCHSDTTQDFPAETAFKKISDSVATPSCHVRPTNQDTLSQAGPPTSGHIHNLDMGWRNASRSVSQ
ncbi:DUF4817 domain-containing protein [Trichonephila clavipes]|nr:DUF4817 domain-containing protein [Trichonephila clavipes]